MALFEIHFYDKKHDWSIQRPVQQAHFLERLFPKIAIHLFEQPLAYQQLQTEFETAQLGGFSAFSKTPTWKKLREKKAPMIPEVFYIIFLYIILWTVD